MTRALALALAVAVAAAVDLIWRAYVPELLRHRIETGRWPA